MQTGDRIKSQSPLGKSPISTSIFKRQFIPKPAVENIQNDDVSCFSVVSYNILADCHLRRNDYSYTEDQYLDETYRHSLMLKELDYLSGDIVCLQEVNPDFYKSSLLPAMTSRGYTGSMIKRTIESHHEGEATFVRTSKFDVLATEGLSLKDLAYAEVDAANVNEEVRDAAKRHLDRPDVILLSKLACKETGKKLTVCNIHVVFDNLKCPDVQCIEITCAINELVKQAGGHNHPHIICGDFNSQPVGPGYYLTSNSYLSDFHKRNLESTQLVDNKDGSSRSMFHHLQKAFHHSSPALKSAYKTVVGHEPLVTNFEWTHMTLDYIFFSSPSLDVTGVLETLDKEHVLATGGTPSKDIPSDHLSLKAVFTMK